MRGAVSPARGESPPLPLPPPPDESFSINYGGVTQTAALLERFRVAARRQRASARPPPQTAPRKGVIRAFSGGVAGSSVQTTQQESWEELHAWNGFLAANLEGAVQRIEQLGDEARGQARRYGELQAVAEQYKFRASNRNIDQIEQRAGVLEDQLRARTAEVAALKEELHGVIGCLSRLVRDDPRLVNAAEQAGAKGEWLLAESSEEEGGH